MTSRKITVRGIFDAEGELIRILHQNGGGKSYFMDVEPSKDSSIDEFFMEMMPPNIQKPATPVADNPDVAAQSQQTQLTPVDASTLPTNTNELQSATVSADFTK